MGWKYALLFLVLAGCATKETEVNSALTSYAQPVVSAQGSANETFLLPSQDDPYSSLISAKYDEMRFGFDNNLRTLEISRLSNRQSLLPQLKPGMSARARGVVDLNVSVKQVLYDGGVFKAQHSSDDHEAVLKQVELLRELNAEASKEIETYLNYKENIEVASLLTGIAEYFQDLVDLAETRVNGGVGSDSEVSLFQLKLSEIRTDARIAEADADADLAILGAEIAEKPVAPFRFHETHLPLTIVEAIAYREFRDSALKLARKETNPQLILEGNAGYDPINGLPSSGVGLTIDSAPIAIGGNVGVKFAAQELALAEHKLKMTVKEAERQTERKRARISALQAQHLETESLMMQSKSRFHNFSDQFRAGTANLTEAASLLETMRQSMETKLRLKYRILNLQRELAEEGGHFWNISKG